MYKYLISLFNITSIKFYFLFIIKIFDFDNLIIESNIILLLNNLEVFNTRFLNI